MNTLLSSLLVATFLSTASFAADQDPTESSGKVQEHPILCLKDYNVDDSFHTNPIYKMVTPVIPLIVEQATKEETKGLLTQHGSSVWFITGWYIRPHVPHLTFMDFGNLETFPSETQLDSFFSLKNQAPFINCSFGPKLELDIDDVSSASNAYDTYKRFIGCALKNGKILIFSSGNTNGRTTHFLAQLHLTEAQKRQILFVGALSPTADNKQNPSLYSAIPGKSEGKFLWAMGTSLIGQIGGNGTSFAAPRVTGLLCRLMGIYPQLTPQETIEIVCLTASKSPFFSTNDLEIDEYLYGRHGTIDPMAALQLATDFVKLRTEGQSPNSFAQSLQLNKTSLQPAKTLRQKLDLINFLEQHHSSNYSDSEEVKVHEVLESLAKEINLDDLYAQPQEFFIPDDLNALRSFSTTSELPFESFIIKTFPASIRDSFGFTPLHHSAIWGHMNLVRNYIKDASHLINDQSNNLGFTPITTTFLSDNLNSDIISFLLDHGANAYAEDITYSMNPFEITITKLYEETMESSKEQLKKAALIFIQHKTFDPQQFFAERPMEEWAQEIELEQKYPEIYQALVKAVTRESTAGAE